MIALGTGSSIILRRFRRERLFVVLVLVMLGLGVGANAAIFTVLYSVIWYSLPGTKANGLVSIWYDLGDSYKLTTSGYQHYELPYPLFSRLRDERRIFSSLAGFASLSLRGENAAVVGPNGLSAATVTMVTDNFFSTLGVVPEAGRFFLRADATRGVEPVAILSYTYWQREFGGGSALGRSILINGISYSVIGVAERNFVGVQAGQKDDIWIPLTDSAATGPWGGTPPTGESLFFSNRWAWITPIGRLASEQTSQKVANRVQLIWQEWLASSQSTSQREREVRVRVISVRHGFTYYEDSFVRPAELLMGVVTVLLLSACTNVALLLLVRADRRRGETALRLALGASKGAIAKDLMIETLLLVGAGAACGLGVTIALTHFLMRMLSSGRTPISLDLQPEPHIVMYVGCLLLSCALICGIIPALRSVDIEVSRELKRVRTGGGSLLGNRFRVAKTLLTLQSAVSTILLVTACLLVTAFYSLVTTQLGFNPDKLFVFRVTPLPGKYSLDKRIELYARLIRALQNQPGVESATLVENRLLGGMVNSWSVGIADTSKRPRDVFAYWNVVGAGFLRTTGIRLLLGRDIGEADVGEVSDVALVNRSFASRFFENGDPIGQRIVMPAELAGRRVQYTIVGVCDNAKYSQIGADIPPTFYIPYTEVTGDSALRAVNVEARVDSKSQMSGAVARRLAQEIDPSLLITDAKYETAQMEDSIVDDRIVSRLAALFAFVGLSLSCGGIYGTTAYVIERRTKELSIRVALGASRRDIFAGAIKEALHPALIGLAIGVPVSVGLYRVVGSVVPGSHVSGPLMFGSAVAVFLVSSVAAALVPARRATDVDPMDGLRSE